MFYNGRPTIGVIIFRPQEEYHKLICQGISTEAQKLGYNVAFFTSFGEYAQNSGFVEGERQMLDLPPYEDLDGLIVVMETVDITGAPEQIMKDIRKRCHCPVASINMELRGFNNIIIDNEMSMEDIITHFIEVHEFDRICFMSGPKDNVDAILRMKCFRRVMKDFGIPVTDQQLFWGDFWKHCGIEAVDQFLANDYEPEVIICANDYMAVTVAGELIKRGYRVPEDICVSGFDGVKDTVMFSPSITTASVPVYEMGLEAVRVVDRHRKEKSLPETIVFPVKMELKESCGCYTMAKQDIQKDRASYWSEVEGERYSRMHEIFMSINLEDINTIGELSEQIGYYVDALDGYESYFMCLCDGMEEASFKLDNLKRYTDCMHMRVGIKERMPMGEMDVRFERNELLPEEACGTMPQIFFFSPLHYKNHCFGYEAVSFLEYENTGNLKLAWSVNIENAIEDIMVQNEMERLINELEYMYVRDVLTGLFNRRGLDKYGQEHFAKAVKDGEPLLVVGIDLDGMKEINDGYGHAEGDNALRVVAKAITEASVSDEVGARTGGDEFGVVAHGKTEQQVEEFLGKFNDYLEHYNETSGKPYHVYASYGICYKVPDESSSLEEFMLDSDKIMYEHKEKNKKKRGDC